jgi:hypothetical protein
MSPRAQLEYDRLADWRAYSHAQTIEKDHDLFAWAEIFSPRLISRRAARLIETSYRQNH